MSVYVVRDLGAVVQMLLFMNECVIVYSGVILCCSWSLGDVVQMFLLMNESVIVYIGVILPVLTITHSFMNKNICTTAPKSRTT
jgi:hypothetical protein